MHGQYSRAPTPVHPACERFGPEPASCGTTARTTSASRPASGTPAPRFSASAPRTGANYDTIGTAATWAVKALYSVHNLSAGRLYGVWYRADGILFYIQIDNSPEFVG
ncbi:hypothetical protein Adu01nite_01200 [Paractinoplanes durhamensis]|uniref:Uncharacterized protein n=1 Tax=Paractinoplanes durhamensis TaxID=113563 RepID=A0ABQ3YMF4_9ACTN|nr:hypothetical protein Adu01nite_01200 [Actinoplanes durhamensis]